MNIKPTNEEVKNVILWILEREKMISKELLIQKVLEVLDLHQSELKCMTRCGRQFKWRNKIIMIYSKL